jgi:SAM-dependent methyltransferase
VRPPDSPSSGDGLPQNALDRADESSDALFYTTPRMVVHIDQATIEAITAYYAEQLFPGSDVLDLMSSWVSHLPESIPFGRVAGLGMNAEELSANSALTESTVQDLNADPKLPYEDGSFDFNAVSVQYLKRPFEVFTEISRVLRPGGRSIVAMSHRCFPTKAIRAFHVPGATERFRIVELYHQQTGRFSRIDTLDLSPIGADPLWLVVGQRNK